MLPFRRCCLFKRNHLCVIQSVRTVSITIRWWTGTLSFTRNSFSDIYQSTYYRLQSYRNCGGEMGDRPHPFRGRVLGTFHTPIPSRSFHKKRGCAKIQCDSFTIGHGPNPIGHGPNQGHLSQLHWASAAHLHIRATWSFNATKRLQCRSWTGLYKEKISRCSYLYSWAAVCALRTCLWWWSWTCCIRGSHLFLHEFPLSSLSRPASSIRTSRGDMLHDVS